MAERRLNVVYKAMNKPLTILGAARDLFFFAMTLGAAIFNLFNSLFGGLLAFALLLLAARHVTQKDPQLLRILLNSGKFKRQYDPAKITDEPVVLEGFDRD